MHMYNKRPRDLRRGGRVKASRHMSKRQLGGDSVRAYLRPNEIVIPVRYAGKVSRFLKKNRIRLPTR